MTIDLELGYTMQYMKTKATFTSLSHRIAMTASFLSLFFSFLFCWYVEIPARCCTNTVSNSVVRVLLSQAVPII